MSLVDLLQLAHALLCAGCRVCDVDVADEAARVEAGARS